MRMRAPVIMLVVAVLLLAAAGLYALFGRIDVHSWRSGQYSGDPSGEMLNGTARVIDGDTIVIGDTRIRLYGIDAPESGQMCSDAGGHDYPCGAQATQALANRIGSVPVACRARDRDRHGRIVATCSISGNDLAAFMVRSGHAIAYRRYSQDYIHIEERARNAGRGIWQGRFIAPADWRNRTTGTAGTASRTPSKACVIKGNISRSGERIYHAPGQKYYERTRISKSKGERWFCSEAEARAAGWRRAKR